MKLSNKRPSKTMKAVKKKTSKRAADAISKKVEEISRESRQTYAVTNNMALFGYRV